MAHKIEVALDKNNRAVITLYGREFDVTNQADDDGLGTLEAFGDIYRFEIIENSVERAERIIKKSKK